MLVRPLQEDPTKALANHESGTAEVLHLASVERPEIRDHEVLIRAAAASVHTGAALLMQGIPWVMRRRTGPTKPRNRIPGLDVAGTVERVGAAVSRFAPEDPQVFGGGRETSPNDQMGIKPANLSFAQAAVLTGFPENLHIPTTSVPRYVSDNRGMALFERYPRARWAAPALAGALVVSGVAVAQASTGGSSDLPPRTAAQLLVDLQGARPTPLSGSVTQTMDLGLPDISSITSGAQGPGSFSPVVLLSGTHTWRVWYADPQHARLALMDGSDEYDVIRNGSDIWLWSSTDQSVVHATAPAKAATDSTSTPTLQPTMPDGTPLPDLSTPAAAAAWAIQQLDPSTQIETTSSERVAGRDAYGLVLTPRTSDSLVGSVRLSLDAETSLPLAVTITPRGSGTAAVDVRYTSLSLGAPAGSVFDFTPPPGAAVTAPERHAGSGTDAERPGAAAGGQKPTVVGTGWSSVVVGTLPDTSAGSSGDAASQDPMAAIQTLLPVVSGSWGSGHLLSTRLLSAVITDDGRFAVGAVDPSVLYTALESTPAT